MRKLHRAAMLHISPIVNSVFSRISERDDRVALLHTCKRENVTAVAAAVVCMSLRFLGSQEPRHRQTEVSAEHVNVISATDVNHLQLECIDIKVQPEEEWLDQSQDQQLKRGGLTQDGTKPKAVH